MDWKYLKEKIYFSDGSLRDIYVLNTSREDWQKWIDFVNGNYKVDFQYSNEQEIRCSSDKIIAKYVYDYWDAKSEFMVNASIKVGSVLVKCYFFDESEIENDITPVEVNSIENHNDIVDYLKNVSCTLNKETIMTLENYSPEYEEVLMIINNEQIIIN
ncbi:hypothetical protein [Chryseobacterium oryzae]|uniref:Immunity protein 22 n=1 Tax=Chryseobacterium oryzae TaxID=2929799 RepID=A0ABY4BMQ1_9FLAO|nr:hypothetical protein [Chryseobacterium oryzae]UOE38998.1 hypothetical protein MTP08_04285 [Chryseobacterium oryzae]